MARRNALRRGWRMEWNIAAECISTVILCIIWVHSRRSNLLPTFKNKMFQVCFFTTFSAMFFNILSTALLHYYLVVPLWLNWMVAMLYFAATPLMGTAYFFYVLSVLYDRQRVTNKVMFLTALPSIAYALLVISNPVTRMLFNITLETGYTQGPLVVVTYLVFYLYCIAGMVVALVRWRRTEKLVRRILLFFPLCALAVVAIQQVLPSIILSGSAATCAMLIIYLHFQNKQIFIDPMLNIPNREEFLETLRLRIEHQPGRSMFVTVFSLRDFKQINDNHGQQIGDELLKQICAFFITKTRPLPLYRYSGDEFAVIMDGEDRKGIEKLAREAFAQIDQPWTVRDRICRVRMVMGVVQYPTSATVMENIVNGLEYAVLCAKKESNKRHCFCTPRMLDDVKRRHQLIDILKDALQKNAFSVYFQPVWSPALQRFAMAEALLRLPESPIGPLSPSEMIPVAEETGLIVPITYQVLEKTCAFIRELERREVQFESVAVNFSTVQFSQENLPEKVFEVLDQNRVAYSKIKIEITESVLAEQPQRVIRFIEEMHKRGVMIGLDDFGTGYSNLLSVMSLQMDMVKLDKSLIWSGTERKDMADVVRGVAHVMARNNRKMVAEGIETQEQAEFAMSCGCEYIQGYLYAKPLPADEAAEAFDRAQREAEQKL